MRLFSWIFLIFIHLTIDNAFGFEESKDLDTPPLSPIRLPASIQRQKSDQSYVSVVSAGWVYSAPGTPLGGRSNDTLDDTFVMGHLETTASCPTSPVHQVPTQPATVLRRARSTGETPKYPSPRPDYSISQAALLWNAGLALLSDESFGDLDGTTDAQRHLSLNVTGDAEAADCDDSRVEGGTFVLPHHREVCTHTGGCCTSTLPQETTPSGEVKLPLTPSDKEQLKDRTPLDKKFLSPHSLKDELETVSHLSTPNIPLLKTAPGVLSEEESLRILKTNVLLERLTYNGILIGPLLSEIQHGLETRVTNVSNNVFGGSSKGSIDNVAAWHILALNAQGCFVEVPRLEPLQHLNFASGEGHLSPEEAEKLLSVSCIPVDPRIDKLKTASRLNTMTACGSPHGFRSKLKDGFPVVVSSDAMLSPKVKGKTHTDDARKKEKRNWVERAITLSQGPFPQTSISLVEEFVKASDDKETLVTRVRAGDNPISALVDRLDDRQIAQIFGHSEQAMAFMFENRVMPIINSYQPFLHETEKIKELWVVLHSLQDCCWWCSRTLSGLAGLRNDIMVRFIISGAIPFDVYHLETPLSSIVTQSSREDLEPAHEVDLATTPVVFHYSQPKTTATAVGVDSGTTTATAWTLDPRFEIIKSPAGFPVISLKTRI